MSDNLPEVWTLQEFTTIAGKPWFALQRHGDSEVVQQLTGYDYEIEKHIETLGITPELLPPITEDEFLNRGMAPFIDPDDETDESPEAVFLRRVSLPPVSGPR